jgi:beta-galactosidase GanA
MTRKFQKTFKKYLKENAAEASFAIIAVNNDSKIVKICAWCDRDKRVTNEWLKRGYTTSHGTCQSCYDRMNAELGE